MNYSSLKFFNNFLSFTVVVFTFALLWFSFVYYPQTIKQFQLGNLAQKQFLTKAQAADFNFPIETDGFKITYEQGSDTYYIYVSGNSVSQYVNNKNSAQLTLKNVLSSESLCHENLIFISSQGLSIPQKYQAIENCGL